MPRVAVTGGPVEYVVIEGRDDLAPLVFLHHGVGSIAGWFRLHAAIAAATGRRTLAYTRHGYGGSEPVKLPRPKDYLNHEAEVVLPELLDRIGGFENPVLIGHSDGAAIAVLHSSIRPVSALALLAPLVFVEDHTIKGIRNAGENFRKGDLRAEVATIHEDPDMAFLGWHDTWLSPEFRDWNIIQELSKITQPVVVISGNRDHYGTIAQAEAVCRNVSGPASSIRIAGAAHMAHFTHRQETQQALLDFLEPQNFLASTALKFAGRPAIAADDEVLTYAELDAEVTKVAGQLADAGLEPGDRIGVLLPKGIQAVVAIHACMRHKLVVAPLDPSDPPARIGRMVSGAGLRYLLTADRIEEIPGGNQGPREGGYILFTSGSTGWPKGVLLSQHNVLHFARWAARRLTPDDRVGSQSALGFDLSTFDLFSTVIAGACVDLLPDHVRYFPHDIVNWLKERRISVFYAVPSLYQEMLLRGGLEEDPPEHLRLVLFAGEPFPPQLLERYLKAMPHTEFHNLYGPTETNVCTFESIPADWSTQDGLSVGRAIEGDFADVIDGEVHVAGATVFQGYLVNGELQDPTREVRFRDGVVRRAYPTGDLGHFGPDGRLFLGGRKDHQVKRNGHRIDLLDIESVLNEIVERSAVVSKKDEIWAYVVAKDLTPQQVRAALAKQLPRRMLPDQIRTLAELPLTQRGKIDRTTLSEME